MTGPSSFSTIPEEAVGFMDWDEIYRDIWRFRSKRGYDNQTVEKSVLKKIIEDGHYTLRCKEELVKFQSFDDLKRIREVVLMILRKYIEQHYRQTEKVWEQSNLVYKEVDEEIDDEEGVIIDSYTAEVTASAEDVIDELEETKETDLYTSENGLPSRIHYDRHLYLPLLFEEDSYSEEIDYSPPGLNDGEQKLVRDLIAYFRYGQGKSIPEDWEVYFLRNQTRKRGIGFLMSEKGAKRFYPDFILWLKNDEQQHVVFLDPHGLGRVGNPFESPKVNFHKKLRTIKKNCLIEQVGRMFPFILTLSQ
jgi:hypothetical protein